MLSQNASKRNGVTRISRRKRLKVNKKAVYI